MKKSLIKKAFNNALNFQGRQSDKFDVFIDEIARLTHQGSDKVKIEVTYDYMKQVELVKTEQTNS